MATPGSEYTSGIKYVRIAKVDANGIDNSLSLSSLSNLRIKYSDKTNPVNYPIVGITEYQDYYQYAVTTTSVTSSADNFKADWGLDLDKSSFTITMGGDGYDTITNWNVNTDNLSILNNITGKIDIPISSNVVQNYRIAVTSSIVTIGSIRLVSDVRGIIATGSYFSGFDVGKELTGQIIPYAGENLYVQVALYPGSGTGNIDNAEWTMSPSGSYSANNAAPALTLFEPYLTAKFYGTDCDVLYGNVNITETSTLYMDIDYSDNAIQAVNQDQLIAGTATRAQLQDFNYYSNRSIIPRYSGSKNISTYTYNSASSILNPFGGENQPIERRDNIITEFDWGGGTYPEIYDGGGVQLRQNLLAGSDRDAVEIQTVVQEGFADTLKKAFPLNSTPNIYQYTTTSQNAVDARVAGYGFSVPSLSTFALPAVATPSSTLVRPSSWIAMEETNDEAYLVTTTSAGFETTSSTAVTGDFIYTTISESIAEGDEWYITFYKNMPGTLQGELTPWTGTSNYYSRRNSNGEYIDPLKSRGVWKISEVISSFSSRYIQLEDNVQNLISSTIFTLGGSGGTVGFLIWKAQVNDNLMIFVDATMSGVGRSGMTTLTPTSVIEQHFDYITRTFGSNTTTS